MNRRAGRVVFFLLFLFFSSTLIFSVEEQIIKVGICKLESSGGEEEKLAYGLSNRLYEALTGIAYRQLEYSEIISLLREDREKDLSVKKMDLDKLLKERDELLFKEKTPSDIEKKIEEKNDLISDKRSEITELTEELLDIHDKIDNNVVSLLPVKVESPEDGNLFARKPGGIESSAEFYDLDIVIYGSFEPVDDYIIITISVWNNLIKKDITKWETVARFNEVNEYTEPGINKISEGVMGRDWAYLSIETGRSAIIYIDNRFAGVERVANIRVESGKHTVSTRLPGYRNIEHTVILEPGQRKSIQLEQVKAEERQIIIQTFPHGAELYMDSEWMGITPLQLVISEFPAALRLKKEGWREKSLFIDEQSGSILNINLKPDFLERKSHSDDNRNRFYGSFGGFILSIPLTAMMYSMVEQSADAYNREVAANVGENLDELRRLQKLNQMQYGLYIGAIGLNIFTFIDTIIQGVEYVNSVDYDSN